MKARTIKHSISELVILICCTLIPISSYGMETSVVYEISPFSIQVGVTESELIQAADAVQNTFLSSRPGFIKRSLLKASDTLYVDIIQWRSKPDITNAEHLLPTCTECQVYFSLMDDSPNKSTVGYSYLEPLRSW